MGWDSGRRPSRFGAALYTEPLPTAHRNPLDTGYAPPDFYSTVTRSVHSDPRQQATKAAGSFKSDFKLTGGLLTQGDKDRYVDTWIKDKEFASTRFRTAMNGVQLSKEGGITGR